MKPHALRRILRHASHLGPRGGWQAAQMFGPPRSRALQVRVPGVSQSLSLRPGTSDVETFEEVFITRQYELPFTDFSPRRILDLGANVGYASVFFAARFSAAEVVAVEPATENFVRLQRNAAAWPRITSVRGAVWSRSAELAIVNPGDAANAFRMGEREREAAAFADSVCDDASELVPAFTVPELTAMHGGAPWDLVKMDVEGAEAEIFRTNTAWLDSVRVLVVELHDRIVPGCTEALFGALQGRRFQMEILGSNLAFDFRCAE